MNGILEMEGFQTTFELYSGNASISNCSSGNGAGSDAQIVRS
jgi:hypothetical protein